MWENVRVLSGSEVRPTRAPHALHTPFTRAPHALHTRHAASRRIMPHATQRAPCSASHAMHHAVHHMRGTMQCVTCDAPCKYPCSCTMQCAIQCTQRASNAPCSAPRTLHAAHHMRCILGGLHGRDPPGPHAAGQWGRTLLYQPVQRRGAASGGGQRERRADRQADRQADRPAGRDAGREATGGVAATTRSRRGGSVAWPDALRERGGGHAPQSSGPGGGDARRDPQRPVCPHQLSGATGRR